MTSAADRNRAPGNKLRDPTVLPSESLEAGVLHNPFSTSRDWSEVFFVTLFSRRRFAIRTMFKNPGFTLIAALSLALASARTAHLQASQTLSSPSASILEPSSVLDITTNTPDNPLRRRLLPNSAIFKPNQILRRMSLSTLDGQRRDSAQTLPQVVSGVIAVTVFLRDFGVQPSRTRFCPRKAKFPRRDAVAVGRYDSAQRS